MTTTHTPPSLTKDVVLRSHKEHERLQTSIERVNFTIQQMQEIRDRLAREFNELQESLTSHMSFEEEGGFMRPVIEVRPHLVSQVEELRKEHCLFRQSLTDISSKLSGSGALGTGAEPVIMDLLARIRWHEERETSLILDAFSHDMGTKD